jgi:hypothetical protein
VVLSPPTCASAPSTRGCERLIVGGSGKTLTAVQKASSQAAEASANIMNFMVLDLLDYAQIKAGKFRKNIKEFNI